MSTVLVFMFVWGVYLIAPVVVDGIDVVGRLTTVKIDRWRKRARDGDEVSAEPDEWPMVSIIVPAHNEAAVIDRCLMSVKNQYYPGDKLEIIIVDDGSTDDTADRVESHIGGSGPDRSLHVRSDRFRVGPFNGKIALIKSGHAGKSQALNAGIMQSTGEIIVNIDSDVVLTPDTVRNIALAFIRQPELDAATGNIQVDWEIIESRDAHGEIIVDADGDIAPRKLGPFERYLAQCQFLEYLASFDLGRRSQAITSTMYSVAGACTAYRRSVISSGIRYSGTTVSEDTALTFELHRRGARIGFIPGANIHLEPVTDVDSLYGQRLRWSRGQLEVCGLNDDLIGKKGAAVSRVALPKMLLYDHTLAFPRLIWGPLFLAFVLIGYSWTTLLFAWLAMYLFYVVVEIVHVLTSFAVADGFTRSRVEQCGWAVLGMPLYRLIVFHFRFSGFLAALKDEQKWTASGPVATMRSDLSRVRLRSIRTVSMFGAGLTRLERLTHGLWALAGAVGLAGVWARLQSLFQNMRH